MYWPVRVKMMYSSKLIQTSRNDEDAWSQYEMQPLESFSLSTRENQADFISLQVNPESPADFVPLIDDPDENQQNCSNEQMSPEDRLASQEKEAYENGFAQGEKDGLELGEAKAEKLTKNLETLLEEMGQLKSRLAKQYEKDVLDLVYAVAQKIIQTQLKFSESAVRDTIRSALALTAERRNIILKINPDDFEYVEKIRPELFREQPNLKSLTVMPDNAIGRGGCVLETPSGDVDATIETQLARIYQSLNEAYVG